MVGDFRFLNLITIKKSFSGPNIPAVQKTSSQFKFRSKIDLELGFNNVRPAPASRPFLTYEYQNQTFRYNVMPLCITNGPYHFGAWALLVVSIIRPLIHRESTNIIKTTLCSRRTHHQSLSMSPFAHILLRILAIINFEKSFRLKV